MNHDFECPRCGHCCQLLETEQEPVAWMHTTGTGHVYFRKKPQDKVFSPQPVYTVPPKREWVGLTADEIWKCNKAKSGAEEAINDLREVIAYSERQEPFCYHDGVNQVDAEFKDHSDVFPLYLAAPQREWVGLTAYEIQEIYSGNQHWGNFACAIEAKLKEKNKW